MDNAAQRATRRIITGLKDTFDDTMTYLIEQGLMPQFEDVIHDGIAAALREVEAERDEEKRLHREHTIQWGKRVVDLTLERDALATRLALAEQQTHADRMTIDDLLSEREQSRARLARVEAALTLYKEYVAFLERENEGPVTLAFAHGWRCPQGVVDKGVAYRARIAALTPDATPEGT